MQILSNFEFFSISHLLRSSMAEAEEVNNTETFIQAFETVPKISIKNAKQMKRQFNHEAKGPRLVCRGVPSL